MRIEVSDVHAGYGRTPVLFGVSLEVPEGGITCVMGRNGVGKTTLLNAVMGLLPLQSGRVRMGGRDVGKLAPHHRARLGVAYVPQGHQVFPYLTVEENLQVVYERESRGRGVGSNGGWTGRFTRANRGPFGFRGRRNGSSGNGFHRALEDVFDLFPVLPDLLDRPAGLLSGGQAQQLAIARALVTRPRTLILDEPTEGIQPSIIQEIEDAIAELHRSTGMTILVVEQYVEMALRLAQSYVVMDRGEVVDGGETASADTAAFTDLLAV